MLGHAAMVGDIVGSRDMAGNPGWDRRVMEALDRAAERIDAVQPPTLTVGDEFQAVYHTLGDALRATLLCRLLLEEAGIDSRYGVGWGRILTWRRGHEPYRQDGPAWWLAREAIDLLKEHRRASRRPPQLRTVVRVADHAGRSEAEPDASWDPEDSVAAPPHSDGAVPGHGSREVVFSQAPLPGMGEPLPVGGRLTASLEPLLQALLHARDTIVAGFDERDRRLYLALDAGDTVTAAAEALGVSVPTASGRLQRNGIYALLELDRLVQTGFEDSAAGGSGRT